MEKYMMNVQGCCGCFTLRRGAQNVLRLGLVYSLWNLFKMAYNMSNITNAPSTDDATKFFVSIVFLYNFVNLVFLSIIPCALGLYGINEDKPSYLKPYIFVSSFGIVMALIVCVFLLLFTIFSANLLEEVMKQSGQDPKELGMSIQTIAFIVILVILGYTFFCWYFLSVVYRYYQEMKGVVQPLSYSTGDYNASSRAPPIYEIGPMKA